jgi:hypothetical protein
MNLLGHLGRLVAVGHESTAAIGALPSPHWMRAPERSRPASDGKRS